MSLFLPPPDLWIKKSINSELVLENWYNTNRPLAVAVKTIEYRSISVRGKFQNYLLAYFYAGSLFEKKVTSLFSSFFLLLLLSLLCESWSDGCTGGNKMHIVGWILWGKQHMHGNNLVMSPLSAYSYALWLFFSNLGAYICVWIDSTVLGSFFFSYSTIFRESARVSRSLLLLLFCFSLDGPFLSGLF